MENKNLVSDDKIFEIYASEAAGFYTLMTTIATGFLGGSLLLLEKLGNLKTGWSIFTLFSGWLCLIIAILFLIIIRRLNLSSAVHVLKRENDKAQEVDKKKNRLSNCALILFCLGITSIMVFGGVELYFKTKEAIMGNEEKKQQTEKVIRKSIDFSAVVPKPLSSEPEKVPPVNHDNSNPNGQDGGEKENGK